MTEQYGCLISLMEPAPDDDQEFNEWYDLDHLPERLALPGFLTGQRYLCLEGWPRYLALYDLASTGVFDTPEYRAVGGGNITPWTKRIMRRVRGWTRIVGTQIFPGQATTASKGSCVRLLYVEIDRAAFASNEVAVERFQALCAGRSDLLQMRVFATEGAPTLNAMIEFGMAVDTAALPWHELGDAAGHIHTVNLYVPTQTRYWPGL
jgi:hypothetical protein